MGVIIMLRRFDQKHYVPILRWKEAERGALSHLEDKDSISLTPLIELVPDHFIQENTKGHSKKLNSNSVTNKVAGQIFQSWGERPFFIDLWNLPKDIFSQGTNHPLVMLGQCASNLNLSLIPVTGIERDENYKLAVRTVLTLFKLGVCLRLTLADIKRPGLGQALNEVLSFLSLTPEETDLLVDFQIIDQSAPTFDILSSLIPNMQRWRNFIVTSGAFPKDLSGLKKNQQHTIPRLDWTTWRDQATVPSNANRLPTYSDYTIQHSRYSRRAGQLRYSASIRYTSDDCWIIMRGENVFNREGPGFRQYPDWAILLCDLSEYCGETYSSGDKYIKEMSLQSTKTGGASEWLQAGINHHMTFVVRQISTLLGSSIAALS